METTDLWGRPLSKLMVGTVQFGLDYGIANERGKPTYSDARAILAAAFEGGVNCLDTAAAYGDSEEVIGRILAELGMQDQVVVVTKVRHFKDRRFATSAEFDQFVEDSVRASLKRLRLEVLDVCLFHHEAAPTCFDALLRLKEMGLVRHVGASMVSPRNGPATLDIDGVEAIQVPFNIIDKRFTRAGGFDQVLHTPAAVFTRSVFLQGLLLMPEDRIPAPLNPVIPIRRRLGALAGEAGLSPAELAMRFVLSTPGVTSVLVGVDTVEQMQQNLDIVRGGRLSPALMERIDQIVPCLPEEILNPVFWPPRKPHGE